MAKTWYCYNKNCKTALGQIVNGELVLRVDNENISWITTEGAILNVQCASCGRVNKWVPKDSALVEAFLNTHLVRSLVREVTKLIRGTSAPVAEENTEEEESN